ncbi:hypothetical protein AB7238_14465, partial [Providencia alcalifaciens]
YHQTNQKTNTGKTLKPWPILVDHYTRNNSASVMPDSFCRLRYSALRSVTVFCHWPATSS